MRKKAINTFKNIIKKTVFIALIFCVIATVGVGGYGLYLTYYLDLNTPEVSQESVDLKVKEFNAKIENNDYKDLIVGTNRLIIPKINVDLPIFAGEDEVLERGIWNRFPERGTPVSDGNFILSGHRFSIGWTPENTRRQSPLYFINLLEDGDYIFIEWERELYSYKVEKIFDVAPTQIEIEEKSDYPKLTLYTCSINGASDGRVVVEAIPQQITAKNSVETQYNAEFKSALNAMRQNLLSLDNSQYKAELKNNLNLLRQN